MLIQFWGEKKISLAPQNKTLLNVSRSAVYVDIAPCSCACVCSGGAGSAESASQWQLRKHEGARKKGDEESYPFWLSAFPSVQLGGNVAQW